MANSGTTADPVTKELFLKSDHGACTRARSFYTKSEGLVLMSLHDLQTESDLSDVMYVRTSSDNGATWSASVERTLLSPVDGGTLRRMYTCGLCDPITGRLLLFRNEAILSTIDALGALSRNYLAYEVSVDGGQTFVVDEPIICTGAEFHADHPLPGVWLGQNSVMLGDFGCHPLVLDDGGILLPCSITPLPDDGDAEDTAPRGATFQASAILRGSWSDACRLEWHLSSLIELPATASTRGAFEPTLGILSDGHLICVLRGSNDVNPSLPGYRWVSFSHDRGASWTTPVPWTYEDGHPPYSPSSCSQLFTHSDGRLFWIGNFTDHNPQGNTPRYPLIICEVNRASGLLIRASSQIIDDKAATESPDLMLSSFFAREDRATGDIVIHLTRLFADGLHYPNSDQENWTADANIIRLPLPAIPTPRILPPA